MPNGIIIGGGGGLVREGWRLFGNSWKKGAFNLVYIFHNQKMHVY